GEYYIKAASGLPIAVSAATPVLERWLGNALSRNGYVVTPAAERVVKAESPNEIRIAGIDRVFVSIEELLSAMEAGKAIN
ncbi:MAG TPA: hypothetical protein IAD18_00025, partial [Candidatus Limisoma intestinavium]|nr:hypothetical protein [Candidatus Limisoma intestinavium]